MNRTFSGGRPTLRGCVSTALAWRLFVVTLMTAAISACGSTVPQAPTTATSTARGSASGQETPVASAGKFAGYSSSGSRSDLTVYLLVDQLVTLKRLSVVSEDHSSVTVRADLSRRPGNAVAMLRYAWDTVQLREPLGHRRVVTEDGSGLRPIDLADLGPSPGPRRTTWSPG